MDNTKFLSSKALNQIFILIIIFGLMSFLISTFSGYFEYFLLYTSLNSRISVDVKLPYLFLSHGFVHSDIFHLMSNLLFMFLYYPILSKIENVNIWKVYITSVFMSGVMWLSYLYFFKYEISILLGASGGIMGLVSYACNKWFDNIAVEYGWLKIRFKHLLYIHIFLSITNFLSHNNEGGEIAHLTGIVVGWYFSRKKDDITSNKDDIII